MTSSRRPADADLGEAGLAPLREDSWAPSVLGPRAQGLRALGLRALGPRALGLRALGLSALALCALALCALALLPACAGARRAAATPVPTTASTLMYEVWTASRQPGFDSDPERIQGAIGLALRASEEAPNWVVPARFLDDWLHRRGLSLPARYGAYLEAADSGGAREAYLAGRLGGDGGEALMARATELDPILGWGWHGRAWRSFQAGRLDKAQRLGSRALAAARDPHERATFAWALARYFRAEERNSSAIQVLEGVLRRPKDAGVEALGLRPGERQFLGAELALAEMDSLRSADRRRGVTRALGLLSQPGLSESEATELVLRLAEESSEHVPPTEVARVLGQAIDGAAPSEAQFLDGLRERVLGLVPGLGGTVRSTAASAPGRGEGAAGSVGSAGRHADLVSALAGLDLAARQGAWERWWEGLPNWLRPLRRGAPWASLDAAIASGDDEALARALIGVGWFREALRLSRTSGSPTETLEDLGEEALAARAALDAVLLLARRIDAREAFERAGAVGSDGVEAAEGGRVDTLRALNDEIIRLFERVGWTLPDGADSPQIRYGPLGGVIHPGPRFSSEDEDLGRGVDGEDVPGAAALFRALGRFALIGNGVGQGGPDATVLRLLGSESRAGVHLGRPFRGTVFWCFGADVPGRFGRQGAGISGAALHEGYYVDLAMIESELAQWRSLADRFLEAPRGPDRDAPGLARWQAAVGLNGSFGSTPLDRRTEITPPLGAADRLRLVVMGDCGPGESEGAVVPHLGDLAHVVATHEEGHLCDRAQWYPLGFGSVMRLLSFAGAHGFSGARIAEALEERAQLVAMAACDDPRLALIDLLDAAEGPSGARVTPHAAAYRRLLADLIERLEDEWRLGGWSDQGLDPALRWIDQLHRLDAEALRGLALREARSRGLVGSAGAGTR